MTARRTYRRHAAAAFTTVLAMMSAAPLAATGSAAPTATSCLPKAPYYMIFNGDPYVSKKGMGQIGFRVLKAGIVSTYRGFWHVNDGYAICKATISFVGHPESKITLLPGHDTSATTHGRTGTRQGHWDYESGGIPGKATVRVYVRAAK